MRADARAPIGVFDSGVGGLSVLKALREALPHERFVYYADTAHAPYGERGDAFVLARSLAVARELVEDQGAKALVVACNTATAAAVHVLRATWPELPIVGLEPALKPAVAATRTGCIGVLATRGTLASRKFQALHAALAGQARFLLQPCDGLAAAIERLDTPEIIAASARWTGAIGRFGSEPGQIDMLVLGCTHYPLVRPQIAALVGPQVTLIDSGEAVARQTERVLRSTGLLRTPGQADGRLHLLASGSTAALQRAARHWLGWAAS
ncbi:glutamate racemase [Ottowia sp.]|uniref:glutamate racemase n=1 Tax=Ottowia sp. TaxID=1898956 RepID=UPI0039E3CEEE